MKVFLDTNVLIDLVCSREGFVEAAKTIFLMGHEKKIELIISSVSFINAFYIGKRSQLSTEQLRHSLSVIEQFVSISDIGHNEISKSLTNFSFSDFEDSVQYHSAQNWYADVIVTRNQKDFKSALLPVMSPDEFILYWHSL